MKYLELTLAAAEANLACDEALLEVCEAGGGEVLRIWEPGTSFVVLGYANRVADEVNLMACAERGVPVTRRCSGGGTVLQGPGCLNYSLVLRIDRQPAMSGITETNCAIMQAHRDLIQRLTGERVEILGATDLAIDRKKFSGNAQRRKRESLLFHGTFLLGLNVSLMEDVLRMPSKRPEYRGDRSHGEFVRALELQAETLKTALREAWGAASDYESVPWEMMDRLLKERYSATGWIHRF